MWDAWCVVQGVGCDLFLKERTMSERERESGDKVPLRKGV